jgi:hypothetical protein
LLRVQYSHKRETKEHQKEASIQGGGANQPQRAAGDLLDGQMATPQPQVIIISSWLLLLLSVLAWPNTYT